MSGGLNEFLEGLSSGGEQDSTGVFTVGLDKAQEKLEKFRLLDPNLFVLNLVSAAVLGGATYFQCQYGKGTSRFRFDGRRYTQDELRLLYVSEEEALQELAVALAGVKALEPDEYTFQSEGGLHWSNGRQGVIAGIEDANTLSFQNPISSSWLGKLFKDSTRPVWLKALTSCSKAPLELSVNGTRTNLTALVPTRRAIQLGSFSKQLPVRPLTKRGSNCSVGTASGPYAALLGFRPVDGAEGVTIVNRGVSFTRSTKLFDLKGLSGVIMVNHLQKNVSHSDLVENHSYRTLQETILKDVLAVVPSFCGEQVWQRSVDGWPTLSLLAAKELRASQQLEKAWKLEAWACAHQQDPKIADLAPDLGPEERVDFSQVYLRFCWQRKKNCVSFAKRAQRLMAAFGHDGGFADFVSQSSDWRLTEWVDRIAPRFPEEGSWALLEPLLMTLKSEKSWERLQALINGVENVYGWTERLQLVEAAQCLAAETGSSFPLTILRLLAQGILVPETSLREWLGGRGHRDLLVELDRRESLYLPRQILKRASNQFYEFKEHKSGSLQEIRLTLRAARAEALKLDQSKLADQLAMRLTILGQPGLEVTLTERPWDLHRLGCLALVQGDSAGAGRYFERARTGLDSDIWGWSSLLMGDLHMARGLQRQARKFYAAAITDYSEELYQKEALAEATPEGKDCARQWQKIADESPTRLRYYLALEEALRAVRPLRFASWVRLRILTSFAFEKLLHTQKAVVGELQSTMLPDRFIELSLREPAIALAKVRWTRRRDPQEAVKLLARFRLLHMIDPLNREMEWDYCVRDDTD